MITVTSGEQPLEISVDPSGIGVHLDTCAISNLATGDPQLRDRFVRLLSQGVDLQFSAWNAMEMTRTTFARTVEPIRALLKQVGPHWTFPMSNPEEILKAEADGHTDSFLDRSMMTAFVSAQLATTRLEKRLVEFSSFFDLGAFFEWYRSQGAEITRISNELDETLRNCVALARQHLRSGGRPPEAPAFQTGKPFTFTYRSLLHALAVDKSRQLRATGEGVDLYHASISSAFADVTVLDRGWASRVRPLRAKGHGAIAFEVAQLGEFVSHLEDLVQTRSGMANSSRLT
jgi:hypothetical protein